MEFSCIVDKVACCRGDKDLDQCTHFRVHRNYTSPSLFFLLLSLPPSLSSSPFSFSLPLFPSPSFSLPLSLSPLSLYPESTMANYTSPEERIRIVAKYDLVSCTITFLFIRVVHKFHELVFFTSIWIRG